MAPLKIGAYTHFDERYITKLKIFSKWDRGIIFFPVKAEMFLFSNLKPRTYSCYQSKKTFFHLFFTHFLHSWRVEIWLFSIVFPWSRVTSFPHSVAEETSKSDTILPIGFLTKTRKSGITLKKHFFFEFSKETFIWGFWRKFPTNYRSFKG